jgi:hypothetical protein
MMADEQLPPDLQQPRSIFSTWIGVVLLFVVFGLFVLVVIGATPRGDTYEDKRAKGRAEKLEQARKEATTALTTYAWVDKNKGVARVPIDRAMQLTLAELATKKPMPANPIATPEPQNAAPTPPGSAAPAGAPASSPAPAGPPELRVNATPKPISVEGPKSEIRGQPTGAANPASAPPRTQPGPSMTPAASPPSPAAQPNPGEKPIAAPVQSPAGTPLPIRGKTP